VGHQACGRPKGVLTSAGYATCLPAYGPLVQKTPGAAAAVCKGRKAGGGDVMEREALEQPPSLGARVADKKNLPGFWRHGGGRGNCSGCRPGVSVQSLGVGGSARDHPSIMSEVRCWATIAYPCMAEEREWVGRLATLAGDERWRCRSGWRDFLIGRPEQPRAPIRFCFHPFHPLHHCRHCICPAPASSFTT
jgi:hypothetical protein